MSYQRFTTEDGQSYGSFEVFYCELGVNDEYNEPGWYWWSCFPGCMPDSEPFGPFDSHSAAVQHANDGA